jgi:hypothetical protein
LTGDESTQLISETPTTRRLLQVGVGIGLANFLVFWVVAVFIGGDALNGYMSDGHYFLASHGRFTEVSGAVFTYSKWHATSVFFTHPLAMLCGWLLTRSKTPS